MRARTRSTCARVLSRTLSTTTSCYSSKSHSLKPKPAAEPEPESAQPKTFAPLPTPSTPSSSYNLSQDKLRALIDLYHSSSDFITPDTLSDEIDKAFAPLRFHGPPVRYQSYADLISQRDEMAVEPDRVVPSANEVGAGVWMDGLGSSGWSTSKSERARMVKAALWGVDPLAKIGLETLLEAKAEMDQLDAEEQAKPKGGAKKQ